MNRYDPTPANFRFAAAITAALFTVATFAISIYAPASLSPLSPETSVLAAANASAPATEVTIVPGRIEVVGYREKVVAAAPTLLNER
jgi:hypothetical protein